jgi:hypothetical protein
MKCPRCRGCVMEQYGETWCMNCGWRLYLPDAPPVTRTHPWISGRCEMCGEHAARSRSLCPVCARRERKPQRASMTEA